MPDLKHINDILDQRIAAGIEYRLTQVLEARAAEDERKIVRGYATTFDEPYLLCSWPDYRVYEVIDRHAFDNADMSDVIMQYDHQGRVFARNRNKTLNLDIDDHGLAIEAELGGTDLGLQVYQEIAGGYTDRMSMAFRVGKDKREVVEDHENGIITVTKTVLEISKLYDVSAVSIPANDGTEISARALATGIVDELRKEALEDARKVRKAKALSLYIDLIKA